MRNPNESKYFDEKYGCTLNSTCKCCNKDIYVREGIYTVHHGKLTVHNTQNSVLSVYDMTLGSLCPECFYTINTNEEMPEGYRSFYGK